MVYKRGRELKENKLFADVVPMVEKGSQTNISLGPKFVELEFFSYV
jgi:hypothetical protein